MAFTDFTEMTVWQKAYKLVLKVYEITSGYPGNEKYGLISDMRRAVNSITNNIAEGFGRFEPRDKTRFYKISRGSAYELLNQFIISDGLGFISNKTLENIKLEIPIIINELDLMIKTLESKRVK